MKKIDWIHPQFVKSAVALQEYPIMKNDRGELLPEIAVAGRSNVGKSTLLNDLFRVKNLVKTSSIPGKTQLLNFFIVNRMLGFVDLPGYGFAKVPLNVRKAWGPMIQDYLYLRTQLRLLLLLFDIRRLPNEEDRQFMEWIAKAEKGVILVLTKVDKVSEHEKMTQTNKILDAFGVKNMHFVHYSVPNRMGRDSLVGMLNEAFSEEIE